MESQTFPLIHVGIIFTDKGNQYLFLRKKEPNLFSWFIQDNDKENETEVNADSIQVALQKARRYWKPNWFKTLNCGFRYALPERDEHGMNALFYQMAASYQTSNGIYFDEELGHDCFINFASLQARSLLHDLKNQGRL